MLEAIVATGVKEVEATAFVSPSKVPALADAAELAAELATSTDIEFSALVAARTAPSVPSPPVSHSIEYVVSAADGPQPRQRRAVHRGGRRADPRHHRHRPRQRRVGGGHRHRVGLPVRRADPAAAGARHRESVQRRGADRLAIADTIGTTTPRGPADLAAQGRSLIGDIPLGAHLQHPRAGLASAHAVAPGSPGSTRPSAASAAAVRAGCQRQHRHRRPGLLLRDSGFTSTSTCRPRSRRPRSRRPCRRPRAAGRAAARRRPAARRVTCPSRR